MRLLYTIFYALGFVLLIPGFLYKMWKRGKYRENFLQRFGRYTPELRARLADKTRPRCWIQAVSVGEVNLALLFIRVLQTQFPHHQLILTTTTSTGYALAKERLPAGVELLYFPQDFRSIISRAFRLIQPDLCILMESEIWPHFIWQARDRQVPLYLVNARMSPRSARRYRRFGWFFRDVFSCFTAIAVQSREDASHYVAGGAPSDRVHLTGNLKYDASLAGTAGPSFDPVRLLADLGVDSTRPVLVAGSTHDGEEQILFDTLLALRARHPGLFLVLVPRHFERTPEILELAKRKNIRVALRKGDPPSLPVDCLIVNTTGELRRFYDCATVIFVGKSLAGIGGQNIVEAAASGRPVVFGPNMQNFHAIAAQFVAEGAGIQVADPAGLRDAVDQMLSDPARCGQIAAAAQRVITANLGATQRTVDLIAASIGKSATGTGAQRDR
jgi:3-deoxy-D-manno-octulosonic-acid transferase